MPIGDLAPEIAVLVGAVLVLLAAMALPQRRHGVCAGLALLVLAIAATLATAQLGAHRLTFSGTFALDGATGVARLLILGATALCIGLFPRWFATDRRHGEFYAMVLFSALGAMAMAGAADLMQLAMGILLSSVTGYVLAAWHRDWAISLEAGMKYFLVGALANALLVIGIVLVMGMTGTTDYAALRTADLTAPLALIGLMLVLVGFLFKLGAVPAHTWVPDVAEGAPAPVAAFLTTVPKIAAALALIRLVALVPAEGSSLRLLVALLAAATMTLGNLAALWQDDVRRLIGWSSVSQAGYALMAVAVIGLSDRALPALIAFIGAYVVANIAALAAIVHLRGRTAITGFAGLIRSQPLAAGTLILAFLSLVGIPPLVGFGGKFVLFLAAMDGGYAWLAVVAVANSVLSLFYYARVIGPVTFGTSDERVEALGAPSKAVMLLALVGVALGSSVLLFVWSALPVTALP
ncbi:NADH dehydrogenase subunit N [Palleronia aestuarii]|uniref:NADH-quinone oxidoreductase subunit N n=1 Tax=Palleronia aestuarii TaxID=568105 RepID=A0A2W7MV98_9RHOB|nr:NADH-quinone oxidoreductase subunit N [Palleronia aestuarii]PZX11760.1 NADH dehydrogenase subunit N [Palleronia aestuarii]